MRALEVARCEKCNGCQSMWDVSACKFCGHVPTDRFVVRMPGVAFNPNTIPRPMNRGGWHKNRFLDQFVYRTVHKKPVKTKALKKDARQKCLARLKRLGMLQVGDGLSLKCISNPGWEGMTE